MTDWYILNLLLNVYVINVRVLPNKDILLLKKNKETTPPMTTPQPENGYNIINTMKIHK